MREHYTFLPSEPNDSPTAKHDGNGNEKGNNDRSAVRSSGGGVEVKPKPRPNPSGSRWQERMVKRYHDHLYKEYALADLSVPGRIGLRWRTRDEVVSGRGDRTCGNKRCREGSTNNTNTTNTISTTTTTTANGSDNNGNNNGNGNNLVTLEVPFSYCEHGVHKKELVKLKLCLNCRPLLSKSAAPPGAKTSSRSTKPKHQEAPKSISKSKSNKKTKKRERPSTSTSTITSTITSTSTSTTTSANYKGGVAMEEKKKKRRKR